MSLDVQRRGVDCARPKTGQETRFWWAADWPRVGWPVAVALSTGLGVLVALHAMVALLVIGLPLVLMVRMPEGRAGLFVLGSMLTLGSAGALSSAKPVYFAFVTASALYSTYFLLDRDRPVSRTARIALTGSGLIATLTFAAALRGLAEVAPVTYVVRDGFTYWLIACAVPVGLECGERVSRRFILTLAVVSSSFGAASFAVHFLSTRGVGLLSIDQLGLPSMMILAFGVPFALVKGGGRLHLRPLWLAWGFFLIACVLVTGTRTGFVLFAGFVGVLGSTRSGGINARRLVLVLAAGLLLVVFGAKPLVDAVASPGFYESRVAAMQTVLSSGVSADQSGGMRQRALEIGLSAWHSSEFFGVGLGHVFESPAAGVAPALFQVDTPSLYLAKFGVFGLVLLLAGIVVVVGPLLRWRIEFGPESGEVVHIARGAVCIWLATSAFGAITEDKGFALGLMLIVMLSANSNRARCDASSNPRGVAQEKTAMA